MDRPAYDAGNVICEGEQLDAAQQALGRRVSDCLTQGYFPFVLGGGHEMAFGSWLGLSRYCEAQEAMPRIGIINFDAHFDLRPDSYGGIQGGTSGTPFYQIARQCKQKNYDFRYCCLGVSEISNTAALFQRADQLGVCYRTDAELGITRLADTLDLLENFIVGCDLLYLTIDLDVLPASIAPGVSAPAARGVGLDVLEPLIAVIAGSGKLKLADIAEYNPDFDIDNWTARIAARLFHCIVKRGYKHD
jgi:formiminoglutamase